MTPRSLLRDLTRHGAARQQRTALRHLSPMRQRVCDHLLEIDSVCTQLVLHRPRLQRRLPPGGSHTGAVRNMAAGTAAPSAMLGSCARLGDTVWGPLGLAGLRESGKEKR